MLSKEHPLLGIPFFFIHPCNTAAFMKELFSSDNQDKSMYVLSWFTLVAPVVGLTAPSLLYMPENLVPELEVCRE